MSRTTAHISYGSRCTSKEITLFTIYKWVANYVVANNPAKNCKSTFYSLHFLN